MSTRIINISLKEFERRFKHPESLLHVTGEQVRKFDTDYSPYKCGPKTYSLELNNYLLKNKKWYYVKEHDTYYNKPRKGGFIWFHNHSKRFKVASISAASAVVVACAVAAPLITLHYIDAAQEAAKKWYLRRNWYQCTNEAVEEEIGVECKIKVNGLDHKVRLIDIDRDVDESGNKVHTTWEFSNLISDSNGDSLAYQWNDTNDLDTANNDYLNSTMRKVLTGEGNASGFNAAQKGQTTWSTTYSNKTIISMIPNYVKTQFKKVKRTIGTKKGGATTFSQETYYTNLFLLSGHDVCTIKKDPLDQGEHSSILFYKNANDAGKLSAARIKTQVKNVTTVYSEIPKIASGQAYAQSVDNYAGYNNSKITGTLSGWYWLSSPNGSKDARYKNKYAWHYESDFGLGSYFVYQIALPIAPCFCI